MATSALRLVNGLPTTSDLIFSTIPELFYYAASTLVTNAIGVADPNGLYDADHKVFILPNEETYDASTNSLKVDINGQGVIEGLDYTYNLSKEATYITFVNAVPKNARVGFKKVTTSSIASFEHYDADVPVTTDIGTPGSNYDAAHLVFTLPFSETYDATVSQLNVEVEGKGQYEGVDFNYGSGVDATTVTFLYPIPNGTTVRFHKTTAGSIDYYDEYTEVTTLAGTPGTGYDETHRIFTLPSGETYDTASKGLKLEVNGKGQILGTDFTYTDSTTITFTYTIRKGAKVRFVKFN